MEGSRVGPGAPGATVGVVISWLSIARFERWGFRLGVGRPMRGS